MITGGWDLVKQPVFLFDDSLMFSSIIIRFLKLATFHKEFKSNSTSYFCWIWPNFVESKIIRLHVYPPPDYSLLMTAFHVQDEGGWEWGTRIIILWLHNYQQYLNIYFCLSGWVTIFAVYHNQTSWVDSSELGCCVGIFVSRPHMVLW